MVWPLLLTAVLLARTRRVALGVISAVIVGSLALALFTYSPQTYFTTQTRIWELAAGALCSITMPQARERQARHAQSARPGNAGDGPGSAGVGWC